jgi:hypothetical protein
VRRSIFRIGVIVGAAIALFGLLGVVGVPLLLRHVLTGPVAAALHRPVRAGEIAFNPFTLKADLGQLYIGEPETAQAFVEIDRLHIDLSWVSLLRLALVVKELRVERPAVHLVRTAERRFNVSDLLERSSPAAKSRLSWRFAVAKVQLNGGTVHVDDRVLGERHTIEQVQLDVPYMSNLPADVGRAVEPSLRMVVDGSPVQIRGKATPFTTTPASVVELTLQQLDLSRYRSYLLQATALTFARGVLSGSVAVHVVDAGPQPSIRLSGTVALEQVELYAPGQGETPIAWTRLSASIAQVDSATRQVTVDEVRAEGVRVLVRRERDGGVSLARLLPTIPTTAPLPPPDTPAGTQELAWQYRIASLALDNSEARFEDAAAPSPIELVVAPLHLHLTNLSSDLSAAVGLEFDAMFNRQGRINVTGTVVPTPLQAELSVTTHELDLAGMEPYVSDRLNATVSSTALTMNGSLTLATAPDQLRVGYSGDATLGDVRLLDPTTSESVLGWKSCSASRLEVEIGSGPPKVHLGMLTLTDFYARLILKSDGRLNVYDMLTGPPAEPATVARSASASGRQTPETSVDAASTGGGPIAPEIALSGMTLQGGHVNFTDNFIEPHYTADILQIAGTVGPFDTGSTAPAAVVLQGQLNGSAPIAIDGAINPLVPTAFVDLKGRADGVELTGLTPYSAKYTGYPIVKGTLTVDVHYHLEQGQLTADNHLFIDQLTFGERVESHDATTLPVRLAVALLKNARGEIAVDVPVSGSLADPQFSLSGVIMDAFANFIVKVATSPFSLIAAAFGSEEDLEYIEFAPGLAALTPNSQQKLATLAQALQDRPALRLDISGRVDPLVDREGLREARLDSLITMQKIQESGGQADAGHTQLTPEEYKRYVTHVYKAAAFPKPRNFLGMEKSLPPDEMRQLLLANMTITEQDLRQLADERANAVRQWLSRRVEPGRLFVVSPTLTVDGIKDTGKTTRVDLSVK